MKFSNIGALLGLCVAILCCLFQTMVYAETASGEAIRIVPGELQYSIEYGGSQQTWFLPDSEEPYYPESIATTLISAQSGETYLFASAWAAGSCGYRSFLFTQFNDELIQHPLKPCTDWRVIGPNLIHAKNSMAHLCGSSGSDGELLYFPIVFEVLEYDAEIGFRQLDFYESTVFEEIRLGYQQFFDDVLQQADFSSLIEPTEIAFCELLLTEASLAEKYESAIKVEVHQH